MHYIVLDLEFNQSFPFKTGKKQSLWQNALSKLYRLVP